MMMIKKHFMTNQRLRASSTPLFIHETLKKKKKKKKRISLEAQFTFPCDHHMLSKSKVRDIRINVTFYNFKV